MIYARRYQLNQQSVMWEPEEVSDASQWQALKDLETTHQRSWMLWEAGLDTETVTCLKSMGINRLAYQPIGNKPATGDFNSVMHNNLVNLRQAFR